MLRALQKAGTVPLVSRSLDPCFPMFSGCLVSQEGKDHESSSQYEHMGEKFCRRSWTCSNIYMTSAVWSEPVLGSPCNLPLTDVPTSLPVAATGDHHNIRYQRGWVAGINWITPFLFIYVDEKRIVWLLTPPLVWRGSIQPSGVWWLGLKDSRLRIRWENKMSWSSNFLKNYICSTNWLGQAMPIEDKSPASIK